MNSQNSGISLVEKWLLWGRGHYQLAISGDIPTKNSVVVRSSLDSPAGLK
jgi:hypothetical protein